MIHFRQYLLLAALCACCSFGLSNDVKKTTATPGAPSIIPIPIVLSSVDTPVKASSTDGEPVTTEPLSPEKPHNKTTTSTTTTTTTTSTTTSTTSTTTPTPPPPKPTPTPAPAPTPAPGPLPPPEQGTWSLNSTTSNVTCIVIQFAAQLNVTYPKIVENVTSLAHFLLNVPANASMDGGQCGDVEQSIILSWRVPGVPVTNMTTNNTMTLTYHKNDTTKTYGLKLLEVGLSPDVFVNSSLNTVVSLTHGPEWSTPLASSYRCAPPTKYNMSSDIQVVAALTLAHLQEEAFRTTNGTAFSAGRECAGGDVPDAVPIAVGCALGGLVVVVLIAYLVGRRRSTSGYLSM